MVELEALEAALDAAPAPIPLWWRDDDAGRSHPRLDRLLALAERRRAPLALAVVPAWLEAEVAGRILAAPVATVLQHGWAHESRALPGAKRIELGGTAEVGVLGRKLEEGRERLQAVFEDRFLPVMVPPWNRIAPPFVAALEGWGFSGLSAFTGAAETGGTSLRRVHTHLDVVDWRNGRAFIGLSAIVRHLAALVRQRPAGPIGLLTHHLVVDAAGFEGLDRFLGLVQDHSKLRLEGARDLFSGA